MNLLSESREARMATLRQWIASCKLRVTICDADIEAQEKYRQQVMAELCVWECQLRGLEKEVCDAKG